MIIWNLRYNSFVYTDMNNIYKSKRWIKKRLKILKRDKYLCQFYCRYGKRIEANTVHHIYPVAEYPQYMWCDWNLISLSKTAHDKMHNRITGELTNLGLELQRRTPIPK